MKGRSKGASRQDPLLDEKVSSLPMPIKGRIVPRVETHYLDNAQASYNADTTGTVTALNLIAEGNDNVNRLGRKAMMRSVSVKGFVVSPSNAPPAQQTRVLLVWDNAANGALPAIGDVLTAINSTAFLNPNNVARFTILFDKVYSLGSWSTAATSSYASEIIRAVDATVRVNAPTEYLGTTGTIASLQNGTILLLTMGSVAAGADAAAFTLSTRVTFTDVL
jgi:hypothetical protein